MAKELSDFEKAFVDARDKRLAGKGDEPFEYKGKKYHSYRKGEKPASKPGTARRNAQDESASPDDGPYLDASKTDSNGESWEMGKSTSVRKPDPGTSKFKAAVEAGKKADAQRNYAKGGSVRGVGAALRGYGKGKLT